MEYIPYTYVIKFKLTGQLYYGVSFGHNRHKVANPSELWVTYFTSSNTVRALVEKHGADAFEATVRRTFSTKEQALQWENKVLRRLNAAADSRWLNKSNGGRNFYINEETRQKMSVARKGRPSTKKGIPMTEEQKAKISATRRSRVYLVSEETKQAKSLALQGEKNPMYGKHHSEETRHKISEAAKKRGPSPLKGKPKSEEQKAKQRAVMKEKHRLKQLAIESVGESQP